MQKQTIKTVAPKRKEVKLIGRRRVKDRQTDRRNDDSYRDPIYSTKKQVYEVLSIKCTLCVYIMYSSR